MPSNRAMLLGAGLGVVLGFAAGVWWGSGGSDGPKDQAPQPMAAVRPLPMPAPEGPEAEDLRRERDRLARENEQLRSSLALLETRVEEAPEDPDPSEGAGAVAGADGGFDVDRLEAAGYLPTEAERLQARFEAFELDRLYLKNQATREGWKRSSRFGNELRGLWDELRTDLGDDDYDATLYAAGRNNRVRVLNLLPDSPAAEAGMRPGDEILRYAGERIFEPLSLVRLTADGAAGRPVELRVLRDGQEIRLFLPRGPLGIRLGQVSRPPDSRG